MGGYMKTLKLYIIHDKTEDALTFAFDVRVDAQSRFFLIEIFLFSEN